MAIITAVIRQKGQTRDGLNTVLQYAMQDKKGQFEQIGIITNWCHTKFEKRQ